MDAETLLQNAPKEVPVPKPEIATGACPKCGRHLAKQGGPGDHLCVCGETVKLLMTTQ